MARHRQHAMGKILIIAEKPSVATDLSRALVPVFARFEKKGKGRETWFENDQAIITSAVGHLVELRMPTGPNGKKLPWNRVSIDSRNISRINVCIAESIGHTLFNGLKMGSHKVMRI